MVWEIDTPCEVDRLEDERDMLGLRAAMLMDESVRLSAAIPKRRAAETRAGTMDIDDGLTSLDLHFKTIMIEQCARRIEMLIRNATSLLFEYDSSKLKLDETTFHKNNIKGAWRYFRLQRTNARRILRSQSRADAMEAACFIGDMHAITALEQENRGLAYVAAALKRRISLCEQRIFDLEYMSQGNQSELDVTLREIQNVANQAHEARNQADSLTRPR